MLGPSSTPAPPRSSSSSNVPLAAGAGAGGLAAVISALLRPAGGHRGGRRARARGPCRRRVERRRAGRSAPTSASGAAPLCGSRCPLAASLVLLGQRADLRPRARASSRIAPFLALSLATPADGSDGARRAWRRALARRWSALGRGRGAPAGWRGRRPSLAEREKMRAALRQLEPARRMQLRGDASSLELRLVFAPPASERGGLDFAARVSRRIVRPVAVSEPFTAAGDRAAREAAARVTLEAFEALPAVERRQLAGSDGATVLRAELLPALRLLAGLSAHARRAAPCANDAPAAALRPPGARRARAGDAARGARPRRAWPKRLPRWASIATRWPTAWPPSNAAPAGGCPIPLFASGSHLPFDLCKPTKILQAEGARGTPTGDVPARLDFADK